MLDLVARAWDPTSWFDLIVVPLIASISLLVLLVTTKVLKLRAASLLRYFAVMAVLSVAFVIAQRYARPAWEDFEDDEIGVLVPTISGYDLADHYSGKNLSEVLTSELDMRLFEFENAANLEVHKPLIRFRHVPWNVSNSTEADELMERYNASAIFWGLLRKTQKGSQLTAQLRPQPVTFMLSVADCDTITFNFVEIVGVDHSVSIDSSWAVGSLAREIIKDLLMISYVKLLNADTPSAILILRQMPSFDSSYVRAEYAGPLLLSGGEAELRAGRISSASYFYVVADTHLVGWKEKIRNGSARIDANVGEVDDMRAFGAFRAFECYRVLRDIDSAAIYLARAANLASPCMLAYLRTGLKEHGIEWDSVFHAIPGQGHD